MNSKQEVVKTEPPTPPTPTIEPIPPTIEPPIPPTPRRYSIPSDWKTNIEYINSVYNKKNGKT